VPGTGLAAARTASAAAAAVDRLQSGWFMRWGELLMSKRGLGFALEKQLLLHQLMCVLSMGQPSTCELLNGSWVISS
jgi:hypothetical protein